MLFLIQVQEKKKKSLHATYETGTKKMGLDSFFLHPRPPPPPPPLLTLLKEETMHLKRKTRRGDPVPLLWRAERWRMKKPLVSVLLPQWPFMRGIRHARSWRSIHWCPTTIWKKDDKNQFVVRLNHQRLPRLAFQIVFPLERR